MYPDKPLRNTWQGQEEASKKNKDDIQRRRGQLYNRKSCGERTDENAHGNSEENSDTIYSEEDEERSYGGLEVTHPKGD